MIRIDALWLCAQPQDMRAGADRLQAAVVNTPGQAQAHHSDMIANTRAMPATRVKLPVHDRYGGWCATRGLHAGCFVWVRTEPGDAAPALALMSAKFEALVICLPWQRLPELQVKRWTTKSRRTSGKVMLDFPMAISL
jgi:hypothetical protein